MQVKDNEFKLKFLKYTWWFPPGQLIGTFEKINPLKKKKQKT